MYSKKHILLFSGWQTCNIGDIGHTPGTLRYLEEYVPEARITVCLTKSNDAILRMLSKRFPEVELIVEDAKDDYLGEGRFKNAKLQEAFDSSNLVIQNSGMHYNQFYGLKPWLLRACNCCDKPFGIYGQSFDGFAGTESSELVTLLSGADFIFCRDTASLNYLRACGVTPRTLEFGPDGCFGIDVRDDAQAEGYLSECGLEDKSFITVTIRSNTPNLNGKNSSVLNPSSLSPRDREENERWSAHLRDIITEWVLRTGKHVLLAPEVEKEVVHARRMLLEKLPLQIRQKVVWRDRFWNVDEAASVYARAEAIVSMEPHSCIIALANGVSAIHYYSAKHGVKAGMFADIGLDEWLLNIDTDSPNIVVERLVEIHDNSQEAQRKVAQAMNYVNESSRKMAQRIRHSLNLPHEAVQTAL